MVCTGLLSCLLTVSLYAPLLVADDAVPEINSHSLHQVINNNHGLIIPVITVTAGVLTASNSYDKAGMTSRVVVGAVAGLVLRFSEFETEERMTDQIISIHPIQRRYSYSNT